MNEGTSGAGSPWLDLASLALIWIGTAAITFIGIPELGPKPFIIGKTAIGQGAIGAPPQNLEDIEARAAYLWWASVGFAFITVGMGCQAVDPVRQLAQGSTA